MDNSMRILGTVKRVFGPIESPYISVKPPKNYRPSLDIVGKDVYIKDNPK